MPTVLRQDGFRFFFYSNEHEPPHMHVSKAGGELRFILGSESEEPTYKILSPMKRNDIRRAFDIVKKQQEFLLSKWGEKYEQQNI